MKFNRKGATRIVIELNNVVIKIPNIANQWNHFLSGLLANIHENKTWKWNSGQYESGDSYLLCPVLFCSWGGWILVMRKADVKKHLTEVYEQGRLFNYASHINAGFDGDDKPENFGYLNNKLVKIDYGT